VALAAEAVGGVEQRGGRDVRVTIEDGVVTSAWTEAAMFRGFEIILQGKDPQAGLVVCPRICGICGGSHLYKSAYALDTAHANLAAAYLTMPMTEASDQLRLGVAVQSLRNALKVYTPETHPERWASTQLNLANSLVCTPSKHQADNLVEAVELYEAVLEMRGRDTDPVGRDTDPVGRARVLANQGNVLAHLGMFDHAKAKLYEARYIFEEFGDGESVRAVRGVLDEVARQRTLLKTRNQDHD
jgi:Nickel-dependent hydrogenase